MKTSTNKNSKQPIATVNTSHKVKTDKAHNTKVKVTEDVNGVRIEFDGSYLGISPSVARELSASLILSADKSEKLKDRKGK